MDLDLQREAWFPAARKFAESIGHVSNYPLAYVYAVFMSLSGHLMGRQAYVWYGSKLYANSYVCLVGSSGLSHKSTCMNLGLEALGEELQAVCHVARDMTTPAGIMQTMIHGQGTALFVLDELGLMLQKKRQDYASGLISKIVELYGNPGVTGNWTRYDPLTVDKPYLSILSGSTIEWLRGSLSASDLMAGFGNRMTFVLGTPREELPWPRLPYFEAMDWERLINFNGQVQRDDETNDIWNEFHINFTKLQKDSTPFVRVMAERVPEKILKCALVQAAWSDSPILHSEIMLRAIDWGRYLYKCVKELAPAFEYVEKQVMVQVEAGVTTRKALYKEVGHMFPTKRIREALDNLKWLKVLDEEEGKFVILKHPPSG